MKKLLVRIILLAGVFTPVYAESDKGATFPEQLKLPIHKAIDVRQATQNKIADWQDERRQLVSRYDALEAENKRLASQKIEMERMLTTTSGRISTRKRQLVELSTLSGEMRPALDDILAQLKLIVEADLPFLKNERRRRLATIAEILDDPQKPVSEKFRKAIEALLVEAEYGNTVSVYRETLSIDDKSILVNIFRLGRVSLFFQTLDRKTTGHYDAVRKKWVVLPSSFNREMNIAFEIGARQRPATIVRLPIGRIVVK